MHAREEQKISRVEIPMTIKPKQHQERWNPQGPKRRSLTMPICASFWMSLLIVLAAPIDVVVPPGNTGLDPSQTSFFQVLNIPTKINKGTVEIITPVELIKKDDKIGSSEAALLAKLGIRPFLYGLVVQPVYDNGSVFSPEVLDLTEDDLIEKFAVGISMADKVNEYLEDPSKFAVAAVAAPAVDSGTASGASAKE